MRGWWSRAIIEPRPGGAPAVFSCVNQWTPVHELVIDDGDVRVVIECGRMAYPIPGRQATTLTATKRTRNSASDCCHKLIDRWQEAVLSASLHHRPAKRFPCGYVFRSGC